MELARKSRGKTIAALVLSWIMAVTALYGIGSADKAEAAWTEVPKLLRVSDEVKPGEVFSINGVGIDDNASLDIAMALDTAGTAPASPPGGALHPAIRQKDRNGYYAVAEFPSGASAGVYNVWVKNGSGWSAPIKLNAPRPQFISEYEAFDGLSVKLVGRNLDSAVFGASTATRVRLNNGSGGLYELPIASLNPYSLTFAVNAVPPAGSYFVEVTNDDRTNWIRLSNEDDQTLRIIAKPSGSYDPLGLGVPWARHFNWGNVFDVSLYGVMPNTGVDVTAGVQNALDAAGAAGGGIVYLANGTYKLGNIALPKGVVLQGQSRDNTILEYNGSGGMEFISATGAAATDGRIGVARLTIRMPNGSPSRPDIYIGFGGPGFNDTTQRTTKEIFVKSVGIDESLTTEHLTGGQRGLPLLVTANERVLVEDNHFRTFHAASFNFINQYVTYRNNLFEYSRGNYIILANYSFIENNRLVGNTEINREKHGFMIRANVYVANNKISGMGSYESPDNHEFNDGEAIVSEVPAGNFNFGTVSSATNHSITVAPNATLSWPTAEYNHVSVMIVDGTGVGQLRRAASISGNTINVNRPWTINPDSTSKFSLMTPNENITMYQNEITNNTKGYYLFGNSYDSVVADNTSVDSEGVYIWTVHNKEENWFIPGYFNAIRRNVVTGVSPKSKHAGIGFGGGRFDGASGAYYAIQNYGNEFTGNTIVGDPSQTPLSGTTEAPPLSGFFISSAKYSSQYDGLNVAGDGTNTIVEGNTLHSLNTGITITRANYGQVVVNNRYCGTVTTFLDNSDGAQNTYTSGNNACPAADSAFITGQTLGTARNNYTGSVGMKLTIGSSPIAVRELGRWILSGNSGTHNVKILDALTLAAVASADINASGNPVGYSYEELDKPVALAANTSYYLVSAETYGGDQWFGSNTAVAPSGAGTVDHPIFSLGDGTYAPDGATANRSFGPVNMKY